MPRNGSGTYTLPANALAIANTVASSTYFNNLVNDLATTLTGSASADGQTTLTGAFKGYAGSVSNPTWAFSAEASTGWYQSAAGKLTSAIAGVKGPELDSTGITNVAAINGAPFSGFKNVIRNPEMTINQRGSAILVSTGSASYSLDGWVGSITAASGQLTFQSFSGGQVAPGTPNALQTTVTTSRISTAAEVFQLYQPIEGNMFARFAFGTAAAKAVTLSFWANASVTGTYAVALKNGGGTRSYVATFPLVSNTSTFVSMTIPGDTTGTWNTDVTTGAAVAFDLGCGSNFETSANAWQAGNFYRTSTCSKLAQFAAATLLVTNVQLEQGSKATEFERRPLPVELTICQRYYYANGNLYILGYSSAGGLTGQYLPWPVTMRATPSVAFGSPSYSNSSGIASSGAGVSGTRILLTVTALGVGTADNFAITASAEL